eukprot:TRINITY_DN9852_c0_g3_i1.p1 TRINITY_DN9852_c0_g3~~TRINITY_DN9852_c0_g3_i1.p1  ORF type:complete len:240 (+),score=54.06 TRINITY_DN9852_c0_g3_i1:71-721(+)
MPKKKYAAKRKASPASGPNKRRALHGAAASSAASRGGDGGMAADEGKECGSGGAGGAGGGARAKCSDHPTEEVTTFCVHDQQFLCARCVEGSEHAKGHEVVEAAEASKYVHRALREVVELFQARGIADVASPSLVAESRSKYMAELLVKGCASVDTKDEEGCTALCYAALRGRKEAVEVLLENHAHGRWEREDTGVACSRSVQRYGGVATQAWGYA